MPNANDALTEVYADELIRRIVDDPFPSIDQMRMAEMLMTPRQRSLYVLALIDKVRRDPFPSIPLMRRIGHLLGTPL